MKFLAIAVLLLVGTARGAEVAATPMSFDGKQYLTPHHDLALLLIALERGFPRAVDAGKAEKFAPKETKTFDDMMAEATRYRAALTEAFQKSLRDQAEKRSARLVAKTPSAPTAPAPRAEKAPAAPAKVPAFGPESWRAFCACAGPALSALRLRLAAEYQAPDEGAIGAEGILAPNRGDGKQVHAGGMACGRPLGAYGMPARSLADQVRDLASLAQAGTDDEAVQLWRFFILYGAVTRQEATKAGAFWEFAWKKITFQRLVVGKATPGLAALQAAYIESRTGNEVFEKGSIVQVVDRDDLAVRVRQDWNGPFTKQGVRACERP